MDTSQISSSRVGDRLPPLSGQHVWLVAQTLEGEDVTGDQVFYTIDDPLSCYQCRIPELLGRRVQGCFHGWVIMSNHPHNVMWSLWNPSSSKLISLPSLNLKEGDINECFLSSPPGDHDSILLLTRKNEPAFVFCRLDRKRKRLRWITMPYDKQLKNITGKDDEFVYGLIRCNGKVYALGGHACEDFVIEVDIVVNDKVVISLLPFVKLPSFMHPSGPSDGFTGPFLKATCGELFIIYLHLTSKDIFCLRLVKLDMTRKLWEDMEDLDDGICFLNICFSDSNNNNNVPVIPSNLGGGYIHIICQEDKVIHSYNVKDKTLALSSIPPPLRTGESQTCYVSVLAMPECWYSNIPFT